MRSQLSPKGHERIPCAGVGSMAYNLTLQTELACQEAIIKSKKINESFQVFCHPLTMDQTKLMTASDRNYNHDEAITSSVLQAATDGYKKIRVLSTDIFDLTVIRMV